MKSSKIEHLFDMKPESEETKTLSPLTYYQPFQSTFDPDFVGSSPRSSNYKESFESPMTAWCQGFEKQSAGDDSNPWDDDQRHINDGYGSNRLDQSPSGYKNSFFGAGVTTIPWKLENDLARRSLLGLPQSSSLPSLLTVNTDQSLGRPFLGQMDDQKYSLRREFGFGRISPFSTNASPSTTPSFNGGQPTSDLDSNFALRSSLEQRTQNLANYEGTALGHYYPLMLNPFGRNVSQKFQKIGHSRPMICNFCKNNKEVPDIYLNHYLYDPETKVLTCPVLRKHVCEICGGTGDRAHTLQYCPVNRGRGLQAKVPVLLKTRTITNSTGKIRRN